MTRIVGALAIALMCLAAAAPAAAHPAAYPHDHLGGGDPLRGDHLPWIVAGGLGIALLIAGAVTRRRPDAA